MGVLARKAGDIATRSRERSYDTGADGVACCREDDRDCGCRLLCCERGQRVVGDDYIDLESHELICNLDKTLAASVRPAILDRDIAPLRPTYLPQPGDKCRSPLTLRRRRARAQQPDGRHLPLRPRRERPRGRRTAEQRDELAPSHSITSSAATSSLSGTVRPSIRAVWWLITSSNLLDCTTGRSAGLAPLRIRPT